MGLPFDGHAEGLQAMCHNKDLPTSGDWKVACRRLHQASPHPDHIVQHHLSNIRLQHHQLLSNLVSPNQMFKSAMTAQSLWTLLILIQSQKMMKVSAMEMIMTGSIQAPMTMRILKNRLMSLTTKNGTMRSCWLLKNELISWSLVHMSAKEKWICITTNVSWLRWWKMSFLYSQRSRNHLERPNWRLLFKRPPKLYLGKLWHYLFMHASHQNVDM